MKIERSVEPKLTMGAQPTLGECLRIMEIYQPGTDWHGLDEEIIHLAQMRIIEIFQQRKEEK